MCGPKLGKNIRHEDLILGDISEIGAVKSPRLDEPVSAIPASRLSRAGRRRPTLALRGWWCGGNGPITIYPESLIGFSLAQMSRCRPIGGGNSFRSQKPICGLETNKPARSAILLELCPISAKRDRRAR